MIRKHSEITSNFQEEYSAMPDESSSYEALTRELAERTEKEVRTQRQIALLTAIINLFRETLICETEEEVARVCLSISEKLTGSRYGFIGELSPEGLFDTTTLSDAGWNACGVPREEALVLLKRMPNRGINRIGLREGKSWIINDTTAHPESVPKPAGHPDITSFMGVPMKYLGGITGMIAVAGKKAGYTIDDQQDLEALSVALVEVLNRRRAEKQINELNEELKRQILQAESANKELEAFSYSVSHDLRAPLRHISGYLDLLSGESLERLDENSRHYLQVIADAAQRMGTLIDDLLAFSRMGRAELMRTQVDFNTLVREVVQEIAAEEKERKIEWDIRPLPTVSGDMAMLRQVIVNLVSNAVKFTRSRPEARIEIGAVVDDPHELLMYVRDNGVGFNMKYANKLFGLFQRLHDPQQFEGTGVGLANVQRIVHRHGGRVWAESAPGEGAVFWFSLPKRKEEL